MTLLEACGVRNYTPVVGQYDEWGAGGRVKNTWDKCLVHENIKKGQLHHPMATDSSWKVQYIKQKKNKNAFQ